MNTSSGPTGQWLSTSPGVLSRGAHLAADDGACVMEAFGGPGEPPADSPRRSLLVVSRLCEWMTSRGVRAAMGDWGASRSTLARWARALGSCSVGPDETPRGEESAQQATQAQSTGSKARSDDGPGAGRWTFRSPGRRSVLPASECGNARRSAPACQPAARWAADVEF